MDQNTAAEDKVLARIKKMMALAGDKAATEGERDNALRMSYKLLAKHNLSMEDVNSHNTVKVEARKSNQSSFVVYPWARDIAKQVGELFFCNYYFVRAETGKQASHAFIGKTGNSTTAAYMANFIVRSVLSQATRMYGSSITPEARSFAVGVGSKLRERIRELKAAVSAEETAGTVLVLENLHETEKQANGLWLATQGVTLRTVKSNTKVSVNSAAYHAGKAFGSSVSLSAQIK